MLEARESMEHFRERKFHSFRKSKEGVMRNGDVNKGLTLWSFINHV